MIHLTYFHNVRKFFLNYKARYEMLKRFTIVVTILSAMLFFSCQQQPSYDSNIKSETEMKKVTKRVGMVIGLKADQLEAYKKLHDDSNAGVRDLLNKYNMHNFSIFLHQFDNGKYYLFGYYEYTGDNYEADMAELAKEDRNIEWLSVTDPMQIPFEGENGWSTMERIYYNP